MTELQAAEMLEQLEAIRRATQQCVWASTAIFMISCGILAWCFWSEIKDACTRALLFRW